MGPAGVTEVGGLGALTDEARVAWTSSYLVDLPVAISERLSSEARQVRVEPADLMLRKGTSLSEAAVYLVVDGLARIYLVGPDGRQATVKYASDGDVIGLPPLLVTDMDIWAEAVTDVTAIRLSSRRFIALAEKNVDLAWKTARYVAEQLASTNETLAADIFLPVRARLARHLLDLAQRHPQGLLVPARHKHLADAIGTVREVVSREMKRFAAEGLLSSIDIGARLEDPAELHRIATGSDLR